MSQGQREERPAYPQSAGQFLKHVKSGLYVQPEGKRATIGVRLVLQPGPHRNSADLKIDIRPDGSIIHVASGLAVHPVRESSGAELVLLRDSDANLLTILQRRRALEQRLQPAAPEQLLEAHHNVTDEYEPPKGKQGSTCAGNGRVAVAAAGAIFRIFVRVWIRVVLHASPRPFEQIGLVPDARHH